MLLMFSGQLKDRLDDHFYLMMRKYIHINISHVSMLSIRQLNRVSLRIFVKVFVIKVQILSLRAVDVKEPVANADSLCEWKFQL